jgi:tetratricopeptide (TPR) repeat protein
MTVAYFFQNLVVFESNLSIFYLYVLFGLIVSMFFDGDAKVEVMSKNKKNKNEDHSFNIVIGLLLTAISISSLYYFSISPARKSKLYGSVFSRVLAEDKSDIYKNLLEGSSAGIDRDSGVLADYVYKNHVDKLAEIKNDKKSLPIITENIKNLIAYLEVAEKINPHDYRMEINTIHLYSLYYNLTGETPDLIKTNHMLDLLKHASNLSPNNPQVYWRVAQVYAWQGNVDEVINYYKKSIEVGPTVPTSHRLLIMFARAMGNNKLYAESLSQAEKDIPGFKLE